MNNFIFISTSLEGSKYQMKGSPHEVMANMLDCYIVEFKLQLHYYIQFLD